MTRAQKEAAVFGTLTSIERSVLTRTERASGLADRLEEVAHQLDVLEEQMMKDKAVCAERREHLAKANAELDALTEAMIAG